MIRKDREDYCDDDREDNRGDPHEGYCDACGLACYGVRHDDGIGPYEFQGYRGIHHDYVFRSHCCDATILDTNPCCSECGKREVEDYGVCLACLSQFDTISNKERS